MKHVKSISSSISLVVLCVGVICAENDLAVRFPMIFSIVSVSSLLALLHALRRAPAGYENEHGFHIRAPVNTCTLLDLASPRPVLGSDRLADLNLSLTTAEQTRRLNIRRVLEIRTSTL
jgi:hypothetical protein